MDDYAAGMQPDGANIAEGTFFSPQGHRVNAYTNEDGVTLILDPATGQLVEEGPFAGMPRCQDA